MTDPGEAQEFSETKKEKTRDKIDEGELRKGQKGENQKDSGSSIAKCFRHHHVQADAKRGREGISCRLLRGWGPNGKQS